VTKLKNLGALSGNWGRIVLGRTHRARSPGKNLRVEEIIAMGLRSLFAFLLLAPLTGAAAQIMSSHPTAGLTVTTKSVDLAHGTATVEVDNDSGKDITAYAVDFTAVYEDGHEVFGGEFMQDCGSIESRKGNCFHSGHKQELEHSSAPRSGGSPLVRMDAKVGAVVYSDQTAVVVDEGAFARIQEHRSSTALALAREREVLRRALADVNEVRPGGKASSELRVLLSGSKDTNGHVQGMEQTYFQQMADELDRAPERATALGISEREYVSQRLAQINQLAAEDSEYAKIRRAQ
jgi:hypothetical protein